MSLEQNLHRGSRAKEVLENEVFIEAFEAIEQELTESWKKSPARDQEGREKLWQLQMLLQKVRICLQSTMESGILARKELQHKQSLKDQARDFLGMNS